MAYFGCGLKALFYKGLSGGIVKRIVPLAILPSLSLEHRDEAISYFPLCHSHLLTCHSHESGNPSFLINFPPPSITCY